MSDEQNAEAVDATVVEQRTGVGSTPKEAIAADEIFGAGLDDAWKKDQTQKEDPDNPFTKEDKAAAEAAKAGAEKKADPPAEDSKPKIDLTTPAEVPPESAESAAEWQDNLKVPQKRADWDAYKTKHNSTVQELKAAQARATELESQAVDSTKLKALQEQVAEYERQIKTATVLNDPNLTKPMDDGLKMVADTAKAGLVPEQATAFEAILQMPPGKARETAMASFSEDLPAWQQGTLGSFIGEADKLRGQRNAIIESARTNAEQILQQQQAIGQQQQEAAKQRQSAVFDSAVAEFKGLDGWKDVFGDEANKVFLDSAKNVFQGNVGSERDLAKKAIMAETAPALLEHAIDVSGQLATKDARITELEAAVKTLKGGGDPPETVQGGGSEAEEDFLSGAAKAFVRG